MLWILGGKITLSRLYFYISNDERQEYLFLTLATSYHWEEYNTELHSQSHRQRVKKNEKINS